MPGGHPSPAADRRLGRRRSAARPECRRLHPRWNYPRQGGYRAVGKETAGRSLYRSRGRRDIDALVIGDIEGTVIAPFPDRRDLRCGEGRGAEQDSGVPGRAVHDDMASAQRSRPTPKRPSRLPACAARRPGNPGSRPGWKAPRRRKVRQYRRRRPGPRTRRRWRGRHPGNPPKCRSRRNSARHRRARIFIQDSTRGSNVLGG